MALPEENAGIWATGKLEALKIRRFVIGAFGDATAYQRIDAPENGTYLKIHDRVRECVKSLYEDDLKSVSVPLVVAAHSLGGHIMSQDIKALRGYEHVISEDIEVNVGSLFTDWNAASHSQYWGDSDFVKPVARCLGTALDV